MKGFMAMKFRFKVSMWNGDSYEEIVEIPNNKAELLMECHELEDELDSMLDEWVLENTEHEWEKIYGE